MLLARGHWATLHVVLSAGVCVAVVVGAALQNDRSRPSPTHENLDEADKRGNFAIERLHACTHWKPSKLALIHRSHTWPSRTVSGPEPLAAGQHAPCARTGRHCTSSHVGSEATSLTLTLTRTLTLPLTPIYRSRCVPGQYLDLNHSRLSNIDMLSDMVNLDVCCLPNPFFSPIFSGADCTGRDCLCHPLLSHSPVSWIIPSRSLLIECVWANYVPPS